MKKVYDKNGELISTNLSVKVPVPNETDIHICEFVGTVADVLDNGNVIVEDQDLDFFEIEADRLEIIIE